MEKIVIDAAIELLRQNGYAVRKTSKQMLVDYEECCTTEPDKDCTTCACNVCIFD